MRDALAERLLAEVMRWSPEDVALERPDLQAMAAYKYDEYQQFLPGMRFVESLAIWLGKFDTLKERRVAYDFIKKRLIFISDAEMHHLVSIAYPDHIHPIILGKAATLLGLPNYQVAKIANSDEFKLLRRKSLFLGLSDGARFDELRRASGLSNEQFYVDYRIAGVIEDLSNKLNEDVKALGLQPREADKVSFELIFLINDFSASGDTLLRMEDQPTGKLAKAVEILMDLQKSDMPLVSRDNVEIFIILYIATTKALQTLEERIPILLPKACPPCKVHPVYELSDDIKVSPQNAPDFDSMMVKYYDPSIMDPHLIKGGPDVIHGYAGCSLPVVLTHNTPNNSVYLLWADQDNLCTRALFPRVSRHREDI